MSNKYLIPFQSEEYLFPVVFNTGKELRLGALSLRECS